MPPKVRITKEDIIECAAKLVRVGGADALNARSIANALSCSTQPVFSNFESMTELKAELKKYAYGIYEEYRIKETETGEYSPYKSSGIAYIKFAMEEKELFKLLFMGSRSEDEKKEVFSDDDPIIKMIMSTTGMSADKAKRFHFENWVFGHGIAVMVAADYIDYDIDMINSMMSDVYLGLRAKYEKEDQYE
jgi:hypothetical protein